MAEEKLPNGYVEVHGSNNATPEIKTETRQRGFSEKARNLVRRLSHKKESTAKKIKKWSLDKPHAYVIGDVVYKEVTDLRSNEKVKLWFAHPDVNQKKKEKRKVRKVFISFKIKRISDVDNVAEKFRIKYHMYFNWLCTQEEYESYQIAIQENRVHDWEPRWYPRIEVQNKIENIAPFPRWEEYPDEGRFRFQKFKDFFNLICDDEKMEFDPKNAYFIRGKYDVEMELSEELELQAFPFDCQDLSIVMRENSTDASIEFLPEMRKPKFGSVDPRYSVIDEWGMEAARVELGHSSAGNSRSSTQYPSIIIRLKMKRRWQVFMFNVVGLMFCIEMLALTTFALDVEEDAGDRFGLAITMVLTAVVFLEVVKMSLPAVPYLTFLEKYTLAGFIFLALIMIETALVKHYDFEDPDRVDREFLWVLGFYFVFYQVAFIIYAIKVRKEEINKLIMDSDEIEEEVNLTRPALKWDYTKGMRQGNNKRLLAFRAMPEH